MFAAGVGVEFSAGRFLFLIGYTFTVSSSEMTLSSDDDNSVVVGFSASLDPPPWNVAE